MRSDRISFLAVVTAGAGLLGFIGVFANWFSLSYRFSGTTVVLDFYGTVDGSGAIALAASLGALAFSCAYILLQDPQIRRITALLMAISSIMLLVSSLIGFTRVDEVIGPNPLLPGVVGTARYTATVAPGIIISLIAGLIATTASVLLVTRRESGQETVDDVPSTAAQERSPSLTG
jgi:cellobiose-specific phosphotransferase system component IIC